MGWSAFPAFSVVFSASAGVGNASAGGGHQQQLTVVTYMNEVSKAFGYLQVSSAAHGIYPKIIGYGDHAWHPDGLGAKINALRDFLYREVGDDEIVFFLDAFDVIVFGSKDEIITKFERLEREHERSLFFNCEKACYPGFDDICTDDYPQTPHPQWRYLNSGVIMGRGHAMKQMLRDPVDNIMPGSDQAYYHRYFKHFQDRAALDSTCQVACATQGLGGNFGVEFADGRITNTITGSVPPIVHFVSDAHWAIWQDGWPTTVLQEVFRELYPTKAARLYNVVELSIAINGAHQQKLVSWRGSGREAYVRLMRTVVCLKCSLGSTDRECLYVDGMCSEATWALGLIAALAILLALALLLLRQKRWSHRGNEVCCAKSLKAV